MKGLLLTTLEHMRDLMRRTKEARAHMATHAIRDQMTVIYMDRDMRLKALCVAPQAFSGDGGATWEVTG